jgi:hypothetical protein
MTSFRPMPVHCSVLCGIHKQATSGCHHPSCPRIMIQRRAITDSLPWMFDDGLPVETECLPKCSRFRTQIIMNRAEDSGTLRDELLRNQILTSDIDRELHLTSCPASIDRRPRRNLCLRILICCFCCCFSNCCCCDK